MAEVATFSSFGFIKNPLKALDALLSDFFETQASQSRFHPKVQVYSYQRILADRGDAFDEVASDVKQSLTLFLSSRFSDIEISVEIEGLNGSVDDVAQKLTIYSSFTAEGKRYALGHGIEAYGKNVKRIFRLNETGALS